MATIRKSSLPAGAHFIDGKYNFVRKHPIGEDVYLFDSNHIHPLGDATTAYYSCPIIYRENLCFGYLSPMNLKHDYSSDGSPWTLSNSNNGCCTVCDGLWYTNLHRCVLCDDLFIRDFFDPKFCLFFPTCWSCLPKLPWAYCVNHTPTGVVAQLFKKTKPPIGKNPKKFTQEELDDFDIFSFKLEGL